MEKKLERTPLYALFIKYREIGLFVIMAALVLIVSLRTPAFFTGEKMLFIVEDTSIMIVLAVGMMCVMLVGSIDISIAAIMALSAMVTGVLMREYISEVDVVQIVNGAEVALAHRSSVPLPVLILVGMSVGGVCGAINGFLVSWGRVLPIVATLGMQYVLFGISPSSETTPPCTERICPRILCSSRAGRRWGSTTKFGSCSRWFWRSFCL